MLPALGGRIEHEPNGAFSDTGAIPFGDRGRRHVREVTIVAAAEDDEIGIRFSGTGRDDVHPIVVDAFEQMSPRRGDEDGDRPARVAATERRIAGSRDR